MKKTMCLFLVFTILVRIGTTIVLASNMTSEPACYENMNFETAIVDDCKIIDDFDYNSSAELFASSVSGTCGDNLTWTLSAATQELTISGTGAMDDFIYTSDIPWYAYKDYVTIVNIEEGVTSIGQAAFYMCTSLTRIGFPSSLTSINDNAFAGCISLINLTLPNTIKHIGEMSFYSCYNMTECSLSSSLDEIPYAAFALCYALKKINIPSGVREIGAFGFYECNALASVEFPNGVETIGNSAFKGCTALRSVTLPNTVTTIGESVFCNCTALKYCKLSERLTSIPSTAFGVCNSLTNIEIPNSVMEIGDNAFGACGVLENVIFGDKITSIGTQAFMFCNKLSSLTLPTELISISDYAFAECESIEFINFPNKLKTIGDFCFDGCRALIAVDLPNSLEALGKYSFYGCEKLKNVKLSSLMTVIEDATFFDCCNLSEVSIPKSITKISEGAFGYCIDLTNIDLPSNLTEIGKGAFVYSGLTAVNIPDSVKAISDIAFSNCVSLKTVYLSSSLTEIPFGAFAYCSALDNISLPDEIISIGQEAFEGCASLTNISMDKTVETIGLGAFYNCPNLSDVYYDGTKSEWEKISVADSNDILYKVNLMTAEDTEIRVFASMKSVMGGIEITLSADDGADIYYTTNGDEPCSASTLYSQPFTIDDAGIYTIKAIAYSDGNTYGNITEENIVLEKSEAPSITEKNGHIEVSGSGNIYYTKDFTIPTVSDYLYETSIPTSDLAGITARCIELGKAGSDTVRYITDLSMDKEYNIASDSYNFANYYASFGYKKPFISPYTIPKETYQSVFGITKGQAIFDNDIDKTWGGSCFGMSATSAMFYKGYLDESDYTTDCVHDIETPKSSQHAITKLIEQFQIIQYSDEVWSEQNTTRDMSDVIERVKVFEETGQNPIVLILSGTTNSGEVVKHAVMPYHIETISDNEYHMYIYDCDYPYDAENDDEIYIDIVGGAFKYGNYTIMKYNDLDTLLIGLNDVALFSDENTDKMLIAVNSNDVTILNSSNIPVTQLANAVSYSKFDSNGNMNGVIWNIPVDDYTIINNDTSLSLLGITIADDNCYYSVTSQDTSADINVGISDVTDKLCVEIISDNENAVNISTLNIGNKENSIAITSNYAKFGYCNDKAVMVNSNAGVLQANGENINLSNASEFYENIFGDGDNITMVSKKANNTIRHNCEMTIAERPQFANNRISGTLKLNIQNNGSVSEQGTLRIALYDSDNGRLVEVLSKNIDEISANEKRDVSINVDFAALEHDKYEMRLFYWNKNLVPLSNSAGISYD